MNLIEKVAKAIWKYQEVDKQFDFDKPATPMADLIKAMSIDEAKCCIEAMPSIKWQKIDTLPDSYKTNDKKFLAYTADWMYGQSFNHRVQEARWIGKGLSGCYSSMNGQIISHWAEINAPEEE